MTNHELGEKEDRLSGKIEHSLPDFAKSCGKNEDVIILRRASFAADYRHAEYALLSIARKFAGLCGKEVRIIRSDNENFKRSRKPNLMQ
jgi:hypothetical protein